MNNPDENLVQNANDDDYTSSSSSPETQATTPANFIINKTTQILIETFNSSSLPSAIVESLKAVDDSLDPDAAVSAVSASSPNQTFFSHLYGYFFQADSWTGQALKQFQHLFDSLSLFLVYFFEWLSTSPPLSDQKTSVSFEIKILSGLLFLFVGLLICLIVVWSLFGSTIRHFYSNQEEYKYTPTRVYDSYFRKNYMASFIKGLFDKRKDAKYGKGHRLGDPAPSSGQEAATPRPSQPDRQQPVQTEAARRAGEAALLRLQQQNQKPSPRLETLQKSSAPGDAKGRAVDEEMRKAQQLKEHYFGPKKVAEKSAHLTHVMFRSALTGSESYPREEIVDKIEQALLVQYNDEPILISVTLLFTANHGNKEKLDACVATINRFVDNILKNPREEKYRKLRVENAVFKEKVYTCKYSDLVMRAAGFTARTVPKQGAETETEDCFLFEGDDLSRLEGLREALALGEPILPELDRSLKVFRPSSAGATPLPPHPELSDDFYNYDVEDLKREKALRDEALEKSGMLRTKAMRERDEKLELKLYRYCLIRVRFPDDFVLQASFKATETILDLKQFVASCLEHESTTFELTGHLTKPVSGSEVTLSQAGLAPAALLIFQPTDGHKSANVHYIKQSILDSCASF